MKTVGVREYRDHATRYLAGLDPVAISNHLGARVLQIMADTGLSEDELAERFRLRDSQRGLSWRRPVDALSVSTDSSGHHHRQSCLPSKQTSNPSGDSSRNAILRVRNNLSDRFGIRLPITQKTARSSQNTHNHSYYLHSSLNIKTLNGGPAWPLFLSSSL